MNRIECEYCGRGMITDEFGPDGYCEGCGAPLTLDSKPKRKKAVVQIIDDGGATVHYRYVGTDYNGGLQSTSYDSGVRISTE